MRTLICLILIFNFLDIKSQEATTDTISDFPTVRQKRYEIACAFFGMNAKNEMAFINISGPTLEFLNGVLVRYKFNRFSLRLNASVAERDSEQHPGSPNSKNYKIGIGGQYTPLRKKEFIYSYLDLSYKRRRENGIMFDVKGAPANFNEYHSKNNGLDVILGIGTKTKIYKSFYVSGEIGYNYSIANCKLENRDIKTGQSFYQSMPVTFHTLLGKLYFSFIF